ncbi:MAG: 4Fe-4S ferredoxin [Clostridiales bacterium]|nr:4Fe-4S ferredoxin [Clostridiales bacterium]
MGISKRRAVFFSHKKGDCTAKNPCAILDYILRKGTIAMSTALYVFSATGNSLTTARKLAEKLGDTKIIHVSAKKNLPKVKEGAEAVGFVFPVYYGDMPWPVRELISKMVFADNAYIFAVMTCRGGEGEAPARLDALLRSRGMKLSLAQRILLPGNSFLNEEAVDAAYLAAQEENTEKLLPAIINREVHDYHTAEVLPLPPVAYPNNFRGIMADENCIGCGRCVSVCPMENIVIQNGHAEIGDDCATCLACFHWCPVQAIYMSKQEGIERRRKYHHPDVVFEDILKMKNE